MKKLLQNFHLKKKGLSKKISSERRAYEKIGAYLRLCFENKRKTKTLRG